jgi:hypothetical protein
LRLSVISPTSVPINSDRRIYDALQLITH